MSAGLPGEKVFWKVNGTYGIEGDVAFRYTRVSVVLTTHRLLVIPYKKRSEQSSPFVRHKKVLQLLPLIVKHDDIMGVEVKPLGDVTSLKPVVDITVADGTIHSLSGLEKTKKHVQDIVDIIRRG